MNGCVSAVFRTNIQHMLNEPFYESVKISDDLTMTFPISLRIVCVLGKGLLNVLFHITPRPL